MWFVIESLTDRRNCQRRLTVNLMCNYEYTEIHDKGVKIDNH